MRIRRSWNAATHQTVIYWHMPYHPVSSSTDIFTARPRRLRFTARARRCRARAVSIKRYTRNLIILFYQYWIPAQLARYPLASTPTSWENYTFQTGVAPDAPAIQTHVRPNATNAAADCLGRCGLGGRDHGGHPEFASATNAHVAYICARVLPDKFGIAAVYGDGIAF